MKAIVSMPEPEEGAAEEGLEEAETETGAEEDTLETGAAEVP